MIQVHALGRNAADNQGTGYMPSFAASYSDAELAAVANYVIGHFGGKTGQVTADAVRKKRLQD